jgi:hypothetical protein
VLHGAAHVLAGGHREVQPLHQMLGFVRLERDFAAIKIRHQGPVPGRRELVGHAPNLVVESPPLLNHDDARRGRAARALGKVAVHAASIRALIADCLTHPRLLHMSLTCASAVAALALRLYQLQDPHEQRIEVVIRNIVRRHGAVSPCPASASWRAMMSRAMR